MTDEIIKPIPPAVQKGGRITKAELEERINVIADLLVMGMRPAQIWQYVTQKKGGIKWEVSKRQVDRYIQKATKHIVDSSKAIDRSKELGKTIKRLEAIYQGNYATKDYKGALGAVKEQNRLLKLDEAAKEAIDAQIAIERGEIKKHTLSALQIAKSFYDVYRDIYNHKHSEYVLKGGRGSTKSSFASLIVIESVMNNPLWHGLAVRQVANTLRDSVYNQLRWAISYLGHDHLWNATSSPLELTYLPTGQKIYFRGADDPLKIKSIKPPFGYINVVWFEELDQFNGANSIRSIEQSALRGGSKHLTLKTYNPPRTINNWVHKELQIPKASRYVHESDYRDVPVEWLGEGFIDAAMHLKEVNPNAYEHEYLGASNSAGGMILENLTVRAITDDEIAQFDRVYHGLDFGYYPDPAHYIKCYYRAAARKLYIFGELVRYKHSNKKLYDALIASGLIQDGQLLICDSAEPKSIADLRKYGLMARGAEKGADSVDYSIKWLQGLTEIVVDPVRAPVVTDQMLNYEYLRNKDGEIITGYPDENDHGIDGTRYATNNIWVRRGN